MEDVELLLSDEFAEFTATINGIHGEKKTEQENFKILYEQFKAKMDGFEKQAKTAQDKWESWKASQGAKEELHSRTHNKEPESKPAEKSKTKKK